MAASAGAGTNTANENWERERTGGPSTSFFRLL